MCYIFTCFARWLGVGGCCSNVFNTDKWIIGISKKRYCTDVPFFILLCFVISIPVVFLYTSIEEGVNLDYLLKGVDFEGNLCDDDHPDGKYGVLPDIRNFQIMICVPDCDVTLEDPRFVWNYKTRSMVGRFCVPDITWIKEIGLWAEDLWAEYSHHGMDVVRVVQRLFADVVNMKEVIGGCSLFAIIVSFFYGYLIGKIGRCLVWFAIAVALCAGGIVSAALIITSEIVANYGFPRLSTFVYVLGIITAIFTFLMFIACIFMREQINLAIELLKQTSLALGELKCLFFIPLWTLLIALGYLLFWFVTAIYMLAVWEEKIDPIPGSPDAADEGWLCPGPGVVVNGLNCMRPQDIDWNMLECCSSVAQDKPEKCCTSLYQTLGEYQFTNMHLSNVTRNLLLLHFFILLWFLQFLVYWTYMIMCGAFAEWYFATWKSESKFRKKKRGNEEGDLSPNPVWNSFYRSNRYHLGSIAFGSLILAIVQFIQWMLTYLETQCSNDEAGAITRVILRCVKCVLQCLECIFDRVSKNGFIVTAITGLPFCASSYKAIQLLCNNIMRTAALTMVSKYIEILGQICITGVTTALSAFIMQYYYDEDTLSILMPMLTVLILSWMISNVYMAVFQVGIDTTFVCFLVDEEINKDPEKMRAHPKLIALFDKNAAKSMEIGAKKSDRHMDKAAKERRNTFIQEKEHFNSRMSLHVNGLNRPNLQLAE